MRPIGRLLLGLALFGSACDEDNPVGPPLVTDLPRNFRLTGTASGTDAQGLMSRA